MKIQYDGKILLGDCCTITSNFVHVEGVFSVNEMTKMLQKLLITKIELRCHFHFKLYIDMFTWHC